MAKIYRCWVTHEEMDSSQKECIGCQTRSCPVNTGFARGPELVTKKKKTNKRKKK